MPLPTKHNHSITLAEASVFTRSYREQGGKDGIKGGMFWKDQVQNILDQPGCVAMRYYYGRQDDGKPVLVLVGVDVKGRDMLAGVMLEFSYLCPPICDAANGLNLEKIRLKDKIARESNALVELPLE